VFIGAGVLMGLPWWYILLANLVALAYLSFAGVAYDRELLAKFGATYLRYARRVHRWLPTSLPGTNRSNRSFSVLHALKHEKASLLWLIAFLLIFAVRQHLGH
jgi:hypothetical protein